MSARWLALLRGITVVGGLAAAAAYTPARAVTCDPSHFPYQDSVLFLNPYLGTSRPNQESAFWAGAACMAFDANSDYDIHMYTSCLGGQLASSAYGIGRTDIVIGDFNENPLGYYAFDINCYGGACTGSGYYGAATWRNGSLMFVDFPPTTVNFNSAPPYLADMVMHVWDVYLNAGTTYYFQFSSTLGNGSKLLLFRNAAGGTYWAGRSSAVFEVSGCTSYTAPTSGYYGLVEVNDVWAFGSYTVGVTLAPSCACADSLPAGVPVTIPSVASTLNTSCYQRVNYWTAVGVRPDAGSDWDVEVSSSGATPGCPVSILANSARGGSVADVVVADFNLSVPAPLAVRPFRYSGSGGATVEWDRSDALLSDVLYPNGPQVTEVWGASDVVKCWDVNLGGGRPYTFDFFPSSNMRLLLFRNTGVGAYAAGRNAAVMEAASSFTYTPPTSGFYGVVVVKDDAAQGTFALRVGTCASPYPLSAGITDWNLTGNFFYYEFQPTAGSWTAVGLRSAVADWDIAGYGTGSGAAWPDCYSPPVTTSEGVVTPDFIVGDFHYNPPGTYHARAKQFSSGPSTYYEITWTGAAKPITVNASPIAASPAATEVLRIYEAFLVGGHSYQVQYVQSAGTNRPLLVYAPTGGAYWGPRGAALLQTQTPTSFTPASTGVYAFVVANDGAESSGFTLAINTTVAAVDAQARFPTQLLGAVPNPARSDAVVRYSLANAADVRLELLDLSGRRVWNDDEGRRDPGEWTVALPRGTAKRERIPAGLYFLHLVVDSQVLDVRKVTLLD